MIALGSTWIKQKMIGGSLNGRVLGEGLYTVKAAAERAGVTPELLRAWERRYGVPSPARSASGYRLYSEEDIRAVRWIREKTERGFGARQAVELFKGDRSGLERGLPLGVVRSKLLEGLLAGEWEKAEAFRSEEHTSELQSRQYLVCRLLLEKKKKFSLCMS